MEPIQSRMARAALGWRTADTAEASKVSRITVARFELGQPIAAESLAAILAAYEGAGVVFIADGERSAKGGAGVRLVK
ncbi:MAG: XRE family transcriptional regulator [Alphaproteobacteria bacterium]|nr:MAG: XRE family transcriptional regulator [Alphaproteobacteria bacterium]